MDKYEKEKQEKLKELQKENEAIRSEITQKINELISNEIEQEGLCNE